MASFSRHKNIDFFCAEQNKSLANLYMQGFARKRIDLRGFTMRFSGRLARKKN